MAPWNVGAVRGAAVGLAALCCHVSSSAAQGPASAVNVDVDGDGVAEQVSASGAGLTVRGARRELTAALGGGPALATLRAQDVAGQRLVAVEVSTSTGRALWVGRVPPPPARQLEAIATLPLGPQGIDGEYETGAELGSGGLARWQTRADVRGCDGAPLRVMAESWDPSAKRWQPAPSLVAGSAAGANAKVATAGASASVGASDVFVARFATSQQGAARADELAPPSELADGDLRTAWKTTEGWDGRGEVIGFRARLAAGKALRLRVVPGDASSLSALRTWGRPARLAVVSAGQRVVAALPDPAAGGSPIEVTVALPEPIADCLTVEVLDIYPGTRRALAISELVVETDFEGGSVGGTAALASAVARGGIEGARAESILALRGRAAAQALTSEIAAADPAARQRLWRALAKVGVAEIEAPLTAALRDGSLGDPEAPAAIAALARLGAEPALVEIGAAPSASELARLAAVAALTAAGSARLTELAGVGARVLRAAVLTGLAKTPASDLLAAARRAVTSSARGDLWRAAVRAALRQGGKEPSLVLEALAAELPSAADYEQRYRLTTGIAELAARAGVRAPLSDVRTYVAGLAARAPEEAIALRQAIAEVSARHGGAAIVEELVSYARDEEAGVRLAVTRALGAAPAGGAPVRDDAQRSGAEAALDSALIEVLSNDRWPEVRRASATALAWRCPRPAPLTALSASVDRDADLDVRQEALLALVTCRAPGIGDRLVRVWQSDAPTALRARAVTLAVMLGEPRLAAELARSLARWRSEAFSQESAVVLAMRAAEALGRLGGPAAAPALRAALADAAYPEIVAAAAAALGTLGPSCPAEAKAELTALARSDERTIALAARRAAATCGRAARTPGAREP